MAAIHRAVKILEDIAKTIWEAILRKTHWIAATSYRVLLAILISILILLSIAFGGAIASNSQTEELTDEAFQQAVATAIAAYNAASATPNLDGTATPFIPVKDTPAVIPMDIPPSLEDGIAFPETTEIPPALESGETTPQTAEALPVEPVAPSLNFYGINFHNNQDKVTIKIIPKNKRVNGGKPIVITFNPAKQCKFGDKSACVYAYLNENLGNTIFISVHSGEGGEAQSFRHALEGTFINSGLFTAKKVQSNLNALEGARVELSQGRKAVRGLELTLITRIPPRSMRRYLASSVAEALEFTRPNAGSPHYQSNPDQPQLVFETCGWMLPGEGLGSVATATSASIYLAVIQKVTDD